MVFDNLGTTVRSADAFAVPEILKISATQVCSGVFSNEVHDPSLAAHSVAMFDGGERRTDHNFEEGRFFRTSAVWAGHRGVEKRATCWYSH